MKKLMICLLSIFVFTGAGCQISQNLGFNKEVAGNANEATTQPNEAIGQVKITFINELTNKKVPGHSISCSGCLDFDYTIGAESDLNGEIVLKLKQSDKIYVGPLRTDWNNYDTIRDIASGSDIVVKMKPQVVNTGSEIYFPETTYAKNLSNKTQLHITYKNASGLPVANYSMQIVGPIIDSARKTIFAKTDSNGFAIVDLPINGAYRIALPKTTDSGVIYDFFQFEAPTGYDTTMMLDLSKKDAMFSGTASLSKNYQQRGMILVCIRDIKTHEPVSAAVSDPSSNIMFTGSVKYNNDICVEVPKSFSTIGIPANGVQNGHGDVSTAGVDKNGVLYLYVEKK